MVVFLPNLIAVHNVRNGEIIWQTAHKHKDTSKCKWLFITKYVSGYVSLNKYNKHELSIFCTISGDVIAVEELQTTETVVRHDSITARGQYVCHIKETCSIKLHVFKVIGQNVTKYTFSLPPERFLELNDIRALRYTSQSLLGFLCKSNILMCSLMTSMGAKLYSLDVDVAVSAKSYKDVKLALSLPLASQEKKYFGLCLGHYAPIYQTDRTNGSVDIVGAMLHNEMGTLDAFYFVTEMQCSPFN